MEGSFGRMADGPGSGVALALSTGGFLDFTFLPTASGL